MSLIPLSQIPIRGIVVVAHCTLGGDQLVFRYPPVLRPKVSDETISATFGKKAGEKTGGDLKVLTDPPTNPALPPVVVSTPHYTPYTMPSVLLCSIMSPKLPLCDKIFELVVDDSRFIGRPTLLQTAANTSNQDNDEDGSIPLSSSIPLYKSKEMSSTPPTNSTSSSSPLSASQHLPSGCSPVLSNVDSLKQSQQSIPSLNSSGGSSGSQQSSSSSKSHTAGSVSSNTASNSNSHSHQQHQNTIVDSKIKDEVTMLNIAIVTSKTVDEATAKMCRRVVTQLCQALRHEENRCGYVNSEVFKMISVREKWLMAYQKSKSESDRPDHTTLTYDLIQSSSLATLMKDVFHGIKEEGSVHTAVNNWISMSLTVHDIDKHPLRPIRPYQTLLILDPAECLSSLPVDASPALRRFVEVCKPTKSFRELQTELAMPLTQLYRLAAHLVCWQKARVIDTLTKNNIYILNPAPKADGFYLPFLSQKFERSFPVKLADILPRFSFPKKLGEHVQSLPSSLQRDFVDIVIWMLRQDLLLQQQTYVYLMIPSGGSGAANEADETEETWPLTPAPLQRHEIRYIEQLNNNTKEFQLFKRLCPYFRGFHHLTEIAWRENISKEELAKVIQMFKSILVLVNHPEETAEDEQLT